jgi:hypothetical protein
MSLKEVTNTLTYYTTVLTIDVNATLKEVKNTLAYYCMGLITTVKKFTTQPLASS